MQTRFVLVFHFHSYSVNVPAKLRYRDCQVVSFKILQPVTDNKCFNFATTPAQFATYFPSLTHPGTSPNAILVLKLLQRTPSDISCMAFPVCALHLIYSVVHHVLLSVLRNKLIMFASYWKLGERGVARCHKYFISLLISTLNQFFFERN